jgi:hypothetical protein
MDIGVWEYCIPDNQALLCGKLGTSNSIPVACSMHTLVSKYQFGNTETCMLKAGIVEQKKPPLLDTGSVNTFPPQRIRARHCREYYRIDT